MINFDVPPLKDVLPILMRGLKIKELPKPRALKSSDEKLLRTRTNAEVFTPTKIVKQMIDALDAEKIFWQAYIESRWLEIACGEAPFITNRYDAESGEDISLADREGILDRKLRRIPEGVDKLTWAVKAVQSVHGYELQADSLLIARANVFLTFAEFVGDCTVAELAEVAEIISRNFWQMDAFNPPPAQLSLFDDAIDWDDDYFFGGISMKFDFVIGNPPYQDENTSDNNNYAPPVYDKFMEATYKVGEKVELVTPARFLFNQGGTPKDFNKRMLSDPHLKVLDYEPNARKVFKNVEIKGGIAITLRDETKDYGAIGTFTPFPELNSIHKKVCVDNPNFKPLSEIMRGQTTYKLSAKAYEDFPDLPERLTDTALRTNAFEVMPDIFLKDKPDDGHEYLQILGRIGTERVYRFVRRDYMENIPEFGTWKVFVPAANNTGAIGERLSTPLVGPPLVGPPLVGCTQTFITVGAFDTRAEADACLAYIKSKFARAMLGILKVTQHNPPQTWAKVPLQDFNPVTSDIDWSGNIDEQLYRKYGLNDVEINFIETHVKEMP